MDLASLSLTWLAPKVTRLISARWSDQLGFWLVSEYPKSGGTWLARMLGDYLALPFPREYRLPIAMPAILHNHWASPPNSTRTVYIYRDGRDVMVSMYFHIMRSMARDAGIHDRILRSRYRNIISPNLSLDEVKARMPDFIEYELNRPCGCALPWPAHVEQWTNTEDVALVSYELLLADPFSVLEGILERYDVEVDETRLRETVERESFKRQSGRSPGQEDRAAFLRKGIAGDWKNYFTEEAAATFDLLAGTTLRRLGYEEGSEWVGHVDKP